MLTVAKFGGSSLAGAERFLRVREIVLSDPSRRVVVVSAAGKRHPGDHKITDLLYLCHAHLQYGVPCWELWRRIAERYIAIRDGCSLQTPIEQELDRIYAALSPAVGRDALVSRGEYLSARLMAELLGFDFVDAADWLRFDCAGNVLYAPSCAALRALADGRRIVTPGFYGCLPSGALHTFSRGGSDITGSLAAAALGADVYENWTDVPGILAADPSIVDRPEPVSYLRYDELQALSAVGMQVLHESAVAPVRRAHIPLHIRSTLCPELPGTRIGVEAGDAASEPELVAFSGRRQLSLLHAALPDGFPAPERLSEAVHALSLAGLRVFHASAGLDQLVLLIEGKTGTDALQAGVTALQEAIGASDVRVQDSLCVLAALHRGRHAAARLLDALHRADVPVFHLSENGSCLLLAVREAQYDTALRAAYRAR